MGKITLPTPPNRKVTVSDLEAEGTLSGIVNADIDPGAAIAESKLALSYPTDALHALGRFASPLRLKPPVGTYVDGNMSASATTSAPGSADWLLLYPVIFPFQLSVDQIGVAVSTASGGTYVRVAIYSADADGWPDQRLYYGAQLDCGSTGYKYNGDAFVFSPCTIYWLGVHHSGGPTLRGISSWAAWYLAILDPAGSTYAAVLRSTPPFGSAPESYGGVGGGTLHNAPPPCVRMRVA